MNRPDLPAIKKQTLIIKRLFDVMFSAIGLLVLLPVFIIVSVAVVTDDGFPVLFRHKRVGRHGNTFYLFKFRTMRVMKSASEGLFEPGNISRITLVGGFLRKTKLDELPQLINVLTGEMSVVGPRPEVEKWVAAYPERWSRILQVKPGITDRASILFINEEAILSQSDDPVEAYRKVILPSKLDMYEEYLAEYSFANDLKLILWTLRSVFGTRKGRNENQEKALSKGFKL